MTRARANIGDDVICRGNYKYLAFGSKFRVVGFTAQGNYYLYGIRGTYVAENFEVVVEPEIVTQAAVPEVGYKQTHPSEGSVLFAAIRITKNDTYKSAVDYINERIDYGYNLYDDILIDTSLSRLKDKITQRLSDDPYTTNSKFVILSGNILAEIKNKVVFTDDVH